MLILALDDEPLLLDTIKRLIMEAEPSAETHTFSRVEKALNALQQPDFRPDVAFLDIEMPGMDGLELAKHIKDISPLTNLIFVTGFSQYAAEAMTLYPSGYVMKPITVERIRKELDNLRHPIAVPQSKKIYAQCFGNFEVFANGKPLDFKRSKTKELLAYLIDRQGAACTIGELMGILWEDKPVTTSLRNNIRNLIHDLKTTLSEIGAEDVIIRKYNTIAVVPDQIDCDYYDYLRFIPAAVNKYYGEYMLQYSWSEMTTASLGNF